MSLAVPTSDPWDIGTLHKGGIWMFYSLSNYLGVFLGAFLIMAVYRNKGRIASDVFIGGLAFACVRMSITCGVQCSVNFAANRFVGGDPACQFEAIAHVSAIVEEFFCVTCLFLNMYFCVVKNRVLDPKHALFIVLIIFAGSLIMTGLLSLTSPIYLMSAGTYCFFAFSSAAIAGWLVPCLIIALVSSFTCHYLILRYYRRGVVQLPKKTTMPEGRGDDSAAAVVLAAAKPAALAMSQGAVVVILEPSSSRRPATSSSTAQGDSSRTTSTGSRKKRNRLPLDLWMQRIFSEHSSDGARRCLFLRSWWAGAQLQLRRWSNLRSAVHHKAWSLLLG